MLSSLRRQIAEEAAMIVWDEGVSDYNRARIKACERLGVGHCRDVPKNVEIEAALLAWLDLFATSEDRQRLVVMRETALKVMRFFKAFEPRLVGAVLKGTASQYSDIKLHLFSDDVEAVAISMLNQGVRYQAISRRQTRRQPEGVPGFSLEWDNVPVEMLVFPQDGLRAAPLSPVDGKPMKRAAISSVEALLSEGEVTPDGTAC